MNPDPEQDAAQFELTDPVVEGPISVDHGQNFIVEPGAFLNFGLVVLDTCPVKVGARTLFGPDIRIYTALHPLEPAARNGLKGPEFGKPVTIGQDCWIGGSAIILAGVTIGNGSTIGAGSVVTRVCSYVSSSLNDHLMSNLTTSIGYSTTFISSGQPCPCYSNTSAR